MAPTNPLRPSKPQKRRPRRLAGAPGSVNGSRQSTPLAQPPSVKREAVDAAQFKDYPVRAATLSELESVKTHLLKFGSKHDVNPKTFHLPIRLHRKETRNLQYQLTRAEIEQRQKEYAEEKLKMEEQERLNPGSTELSGNGDFRRYPVYDLSNDPNVAPDPVKTQEQKLLEKRARQMAQIAPDGGARKNKQVLKRKTRQIRAIDDEVRKLRYEEYYPWVLEDYDGKNTWVGNYEAASTDYAILIPQPDQSFVLAPLDKVYRFTPRNKYSTLTLEEAEAKMEAKQAVPRWLMKHLDEQEQKLTRYERTKQKLKTVVGTKEGDTGARDSDNDDLDFDEDFADDEEAPIIDGNEEENKESEARIKKEMRGANIHGEEEVDDDDDDDLFGEKREIFDKDGERVRKTLLKTEAGMMYESDEEANPYLNESDIEQPDEEEEIVKADLSRPMSPAGGLGQRQSSPPTNRIKVKYVNNPVGMVVLKALPSVLVKFPKGDWNPYGKKRALELSGPSSPTKRVKLEESNVKLEQIPTEIPPEGSPVAPSTTANDSNILTEQDLIDAVKSERLTAKALIGKLRSKLTVDPENKNRMKVLVKKLMKSTEGGILVLKSESS